MPNFTDLAGLAGVASAIAASVLLLPWSRRFDGRRRAWLIVSVFVTALAPFNGFPIAAYVRGVTGDLSITTLVLVGCALLKPRACCAVADARPRFTLLALIALSALVFYPMALGFGAFDPYRLGYGNLWFVSILLLIALAAWFRRYYLIALCIAFADIAWAIGWYESGNLWDYFLDPFVSIYALAALAIGTVKFLKGRISAGQTKQTGSGNLS